MTEQNLTDLLERAAQRTPVGAPPTAQLLARYHRLRRRRTAVTTAAASVAVVAVVGGTALLSGPGSRYDPGPAGTSVSPAPTEGGTASPAPKRDFTSTSLNGTWTLRALIGPNGQSVLPAFYAHKVQMTFTDGRMTGTTGCNDVFGSYRQTGEQGRDLVFPRAQLRSTLVGCRDEPPLDTRLLAVRHVSGSGDVRYLHAANWMIIAELRPTPSDSAKPTSGTHGALTNQEYAFARDLARQEIRRQEDATVASATVTVSRGKVTDSNLDYSCTSGRLLHIKLIGSFPHIVISPLDSAKPGTAPPAPTVDAVVLTADAHTGRPCLSGVQTGEVAPDPGAISLLLD
jgi:hypothetical protein